MGEASGLVWAMYVAAGLVMPLFYVSQIAACLRDRSELVAYSLSKCAIHIALRFVMLPFIVATGTPTMVVIVSLDLAGRLAELVAAWFSLRRAGWTAQRIASRVARLDFLANGSPMGEVGTVTGSQVTPAHEPRQQDSEPRMSSPGLAPLCVPDQGGAASADNSNSRASTCCP